jgi:hypothetical protein
VCQPGSAVFAFSISFSSFFFVDLNLQMSIFENFQKLKIVSNFKIIQK